MRAKEILREDYNQSLQSDLTNLLVGAKANGASNVSTQAVADQMQAMGYSVDVNSLMTMLQNNPAITGATPETITFASQDANAQAGGPTQDSASQVSDMAQSATKIG